MLSASHKEAPEFKSRLEHFFVVFYVLAASVLSKLLPTVHRYTAVILTYLPFHGNQLI